MKIVIVGDGKIGYALAEQLSKEKHDIVVIDRNPEVLKESSEVLDVITVRGNGASLEAQRKAGVEKSDLLIAVTDSDETNLLCCVLAKRLGCAHTISRVRNPEYVQQTSFLREDLGLSMMINPEKSAAREIFRLIQFPALVKRDSFAKGRVELVELVIKPGSKLSGMRLDRINDVLKTRILICAVERGDGVVIPGGDFILEENDRITVTAPRASLALMLQNLGYSQHKVRNVMIIGGSQIGRYAAEELLKSGVAVKIIEKNQARCLELSESLPSADIVNADGTLHSILISEGIAGTDAVLAATEIDEENIVISLFAAKQGNIKTLTKISRTEYSDLFADRGLGSVICPKEMAASNITRYVRAMSNTLGGEVLALHRIAGGKAEALEFAVSEDSMYRGIPLSKLRIRPNILISCINHMGSAVIPGGNDRFSAGDTVIVIAAADSQTICSLDDIFEK